jgi:beta-lactamase class A
VRETSKTTETQRHRDKIYFGRAYLLFAALLLMFAGIEDQIQQEMQKFGATSVGIYYENFAGKIFAYNADKVFHAASTMKVPVMMEVFRQVESGSLKLDQPVLVKNEFRSIVDGSAYALSPADDSDTELYKKVGTSMLLRELLERMINRSSNLATNLIIQLVDAKNVMDLMSTIGAKDMTVLRGVEDEKAYEAGKNNTTSARALAICLKAIQTSDLYSEASRDQMFEILHSQQFRSGIPTGLQEKETGLVIGNKDGWITEISHDSAIIKDKSGHVAYMVILTEGVKEDQDVKGKQLVAALAHFLWNF